MYFVRVFVSACVYVLMYMCDYIWYTDVGCWYSHLDDAIGGGEGGGEYRGRGGVEEGRGRGWDESLHAWHIWLDQVCVALLGGNHMVPPHHTYGDHFLNYMDAKFFCRFWKRSYHVLAYFAWDTLASILSSLFRSDLYRLLFVLPL